MNSIVFIIFKNILWIILGIILRVIYDKYYYRNKVKDEESIINDSYQRDKLREFKINLLLREEPRVIKFDPKKFNYLGYFYSWLDFRNYIDTHSPNEYIGSIFSIANNHSSKNYRDVYHYYMIIDTTTIEEIQLPN